MVRTWCWGKMLSTVVVLSLAAFGGAGLMAEEPLKPAPLPPTSDSEPLPLAMLASCADETDSECCEGCDSEEDESECADECESSCADDVDMDCCEECEPLCTDICGTSCDGETEPLCTDICSPCKSGYALDCSDECEPLCCDECEEECCEECEPDCSEEMCCEETGCCTCKKCCKSARRRACGWYVSVSGGGTLRETTKESDDATTFLKFNKGFLANAALGCDLDFCRIEIESSFMNNEVDLAGSDGVTSGSTGNVNLRAFMLNIYHDLKLRGTGCKPYIGGGLGVYQSEINSLYPEYFNTFGGAYEDNPVNSTSDTSFAFQVRAGVSRPLGNRSEFFSGYRYFKGSDLDFAGAQLSATGPIYELDGAEIHAAEMGVRVRF